MSLIQDYVANVKLTDFAPLDAPTIRTSELDAVNAEHSVTRRLRVMRQSKAAAFWTRFLGANAPGNWVSTVLRSPRPIMESTGEFVILVAVEPLVIEGRGDDSNVDLIVFRDAADAEASRLPDDLPVALLGGERVSGDIALFLHPETEVPKVWEDWLDGFDTLAGYFRESIVYDLIAATRAQDMAKELTRIIRSASVRGQRAWVEGVMEAVMERPGGVPVARFLTDNMDAFVRPDNDGGPHGH